MSKKIDIEITQDKYTNFIVYDGSDRTNVQIDWIDVQDLTKIEVIFKSTSEHLNDNMNYVFDTSKKAIHRGNDPFTSYNFSGFDKAETLLFNVNGIDYTLIVNTNITTIAQLVSVLNAQMEGGNEVFNNVGQYVEIRTINTGSSQYIIIYDSVLGSRLGFRPGIYRGNDINWGSPSLLQKDIYQYIYIEDLNFVGSIPDGQWDVQINVEYDEGGGVIVYTDPYTIFSYKITEIYRAKIFEYIAKNFKEFEKVEQRVWTTVERTMYSILQFDAAYKSFKAALEVGNLRSSNTILSYLIQYRQLNPILWLPLS